MKSPVLAATALSLLLASMTACQNSSGPSPSNAGNLGSPGYSGFPTSNGGVAGTPQAFPVPSLFFYSGATFSGEIEDSLYFGNRVALLFYLGGQGPAARNANAACVTIATGQSGLFPVGYSAIQGYQPIWQGAQTQRYSQLRVTEGQSIGTITAWKTRSGKPLSGLQGGSYLVCVRDRYNRGHGDAMGFYFQANGQMGPALNVNMNFSNYRYGFSEVYFGKTFIRAPGRRAPGAPDAVRPPPRRSQVGQRGAPPPSG